MFSIKIWRGIRLVFPNGILPAVTCILHGLSVHAAFSPHAYASFPGPFCIMLSVSNFSLLVSYIAFFIYLCAICNCSFGLFVFISPCGLLHFAYYSAFILHAVAYLIIWKPLAKNCRKYCVNKVNFETQWSLWPWKLSHSHKKLINSMSCPWSQYLRIWKPLAKNCKKYCVNKLW